jgi:hypothetical protein
MELYTIEFYSATKKNEILSFKSKCMKLEKIILREVSQAQKVKNCMFSLICSNIIGHVSHTKVRMCTGGIGKGKET